MTQLFKCPGCGGPVSPAANACPRCGQQISGIASQQQPAQPPQPAQPAQPAKPVVAPTVPMPAINEPAAPTPAPAPPAPAAPQPAAPAPAAPQPAAPGVDAAAVMTTAPPRKRRRIGLIIGLSVGIPVGVILILLIGGGLFSYLMVGAAEDEMYGAMMEADQQMTASLEVVSLQTGVEIYRLQNPTACPSYSDLVMAGVVTPDTSSTDPWGYPYVFDCSSGVPIVYSVGPDGTAGTYDDIRG